MDPNARLETDGDKKESGGVLRQILNPSGKKRDDVAYGENAHTTGDKVGTTETTRSDHLGPTAAAVGVGAGAGAS